MPCKSLITDWGKSISDTLVSCHRISLRRISLRDARSSPAARPSGGERKYDDLEKRLAALPVVTVPAITMEGDSNGAIHAPSTAIATSSPASMTTGSSPAASATTFRRKPRRPLPRRSLMSIAFDTP